MIITCTKFKEHRSGALLGFADFLLDINGFKIEINSCSLYEKDGRKWVNMPSKEYTTNQGEKKYRSYAWLPEKDQLKAFNEGAKQAIYDYMGNPQQQQQQQYSPQQQEYGQQQQQYNPQQQQQSFQQNPQHIQQQQNNSNLPF